MTPLRLSDLEPVTAAIVRAALAAERAAHIHTAADPPAGHEGSPGDGPAVSEATPSGRPARRRPKAAA